MARYYFNVHDGDTFVIDNEGQELIEIADAQLEAVETLADMVGDLYTRPLNSSGHPMSVEVGDENGPLFLVGFEFLRGARLKSPEV